MGTCYWQGERIKLRPFEPSDWEVFYNWNQDDEMARHLYYIPFPQSKDATQRWTAQTAAQAQEGDNFRWLIADLAGEVVGSIDTHDCQPRHGVFSYGLYIRGEQRRKGYAFEAVNLVLRYYFQELRYHKAHVSVYSFNEPSIRLHQKLGFQQEGRLRQMIYSNGRYFDRLE